MTIDKITAEQDTIFLPNGRGVCLAAFHGETDAYKYASKIAVAYNAYDKLTRDNAALVEVLGEVLSLYEDVEDISSNTYKKACDALLQAKGDLWPT